MPCIRLGLTQWQLLPVTQSSSVFGVIFIGMLIVLMNVLLAQSVLLKKKAGKTARFAGAAALVFFLNATLGMIMLSGGKNPEQPVSVAAVQFNVPFTQNEGEGRFEKAVTMALTAAQEKPQLIFLPENTVYGSLAEDEQLQEHFAAVTRESGGYLFTGVYGLHGYKLRNSVFMGKSAAFITNSTLFLFLRTALKTNLHLRPVRSAGFLIRRMEPWEQ